MPTRGPRRAVFRFWAAAALAAGGATLLNGCLPEQPRFHGVDVTGADYAKDLRLLDQHGQPRTLKDFPGKVVVLFFGYTQCPDVCPTTMTELVEVKRRLGPDGDRLQALFVTLDPARDTPEVLKAYLGHFDPTFLALIPASAQELAAVTQAFKIYAKKVEGRTPTSYTLDHSAGSYIYDTRGQLRVYSRYGSGAPALADDIRLLLKQPS